MARRRYLVAYDIRDPKRLRQVAKTLEGFGTRVQYSVFICDLSSQELTMMRWSLADIVGHGDFVMSVDLGDPAQPNRFEFLGPGPALPTFGAVIV